MKFKNIIAPALIIGSAGAGYYVWQQWEGANAPPTMRPDGSATQKGVLITQKTVDWEVLTRSVLAQNSSFLTLTVKEDRIQDQEVEKLFMDWLLRRFDVKLSSQARVRVKYHAEYPIGYALEPGSFTVAGDAQGIAIELHRPQLVAAPSVKLLSAEVIDSGIVIDEQKALVQLQQSIQPLTEERAQIILKRKDIIPRSEKALRAFLEPMLVKQANGSTPPPIRFSYYR